MLHPMTCYMHRPSFLWILLAPHPPPKFNNCAVERNELLLARRAYARGEVQINKTLNTLVNGFYHVPSTTVMRCVELCARRLGQALAGRWTERGTDYDKKLVFTVW